MAIPFLNNVDLNGNEIQNVDLQELAAPPSNPTKSRIYYDTTVNSIRFYNGTDWVTVNSIDISGKIDKVEAAVSGNIATFITGGGLQDSGVKTTSLQTKISATGILKGLGSGSVSSATPNTDYLIPIETFTINNLSMISNLGTLIDSGYSVSDILGAIPLGGTDNPLMNGSASPGNASTYSKSNHVHPTDTSKQPIITGIAGIIKSSGANGNVSAAVPGTDYLVPVPTPTSGNLVSMTSSGTLQNSGKSTSDFLASSLKGAANGVAELDSSGKVPSNQLPNYVDDVIDLQNITGSVPGSPTEGMRYYNPSGTLIYTYTSGAWNSGVTPTDGTIYVNLADSNTYRWSGTILVQISQSIAIGTTSDTAAAGNRGLPTGGAVGQYLTKTSTNNYECQWQDLPVAIKKYTTTNPALTPTGGLCSWTVTHSLNSRSVIVDVSLTASPYTQVFTEIDKTSTSAITVHLVSSVDIPEGTYTATVIG